MWTIEEASVMDREQQVSHGIFDIVD
jgi:hypothetical protein